MNIKHALKKPYFIAKHPYPLWFYLFNRKARRLHEANVRELTPLQARIQKELFSSGISFSSVDELFPGTDTLKKLTDYADQLKARAKSQPRKTFLQSLWDMKADLDFDNPFMLLSVHPALLNVANQYMGMFTRLKHSTLNLTVPVPPGEKEQFSQRWHRDPEEQKMLKVFIYLTDVTPGCGPFTYVRGSNYDGKYGSLFPQKPPQGVYPDAAAVEKAIAAEDIVIATGKAGTVIFCDTSGIHKGGYATAGERLMFTAFYASSSYSEKPWYGRTRNTEHEESRPEVKFALHKR